MDTLKTFREVLEGRDSGRFTRPLSSFMARPELAQFQAQPASGAAQTALGTPFGARRGPSRWPFRWGLFSALVAAVTGVVLVGCSVSSPGSLSSAAIETKIAAELARTYKVAPPHVGCPAAVPDQSGTHFTCTATLDGQPLRVAGVVTGPGGHVAVHAASAVVVKSGAEAKIGQILSKRAGRPVSVLCALPPLLVADPGLGFGCVAEIAGVEHHLAVTVVNLAGDLRYQPAKPG